MIHFKVFKKLPRYISKSFPVLFNSPSECNEDECIIVMYEDVLPIGCCCIESEDSIIDNNGNIKINLHIHKFEIRPRYRGKGYGKQMFKHITKFPINKISLVYLDEPALLFWKSLGFCKESEDSSNLYKILQK